MVQALFGSTPIQAQSGDRLVSKVVGAAIAALFKRSDKVEANVRAEPVAKLLQGSVDGFDFIGNGMLMYNGLRIAVMELYLQAVSIDFSAIFTGQVKLRQPTQAVMRVVLTEDDLTASFNTPFIVEKLQRLQYQGQPLHFNQTEMTVTADKTLTFRSQIRVGDAPEPTGVDFSAGVEVEDRRKIRFVDVRCEGDEASQNLARALVEHVNNLLDLDNFALEGTQLRVDRVRIQNDALIFYGSARIDHFPKGKKR
jgi:stringent starvation protein B